MSRNLMQAKNFHYSKLLKPLPLSIIFVLILLILDWFFPNFLSKFSFLIILICAILFGFLPKQLTTLSSKISKVKKEKRIDIVSPLEAVPQIFKFKTFFNFQDLIHNTLQETAAFIENLPPSSVSIFAHLSSKNQRYPINLGTLIQQVKELSLPLFVHPIFSIPQKKLSSNKLEVFLSIPEKEQTVPLKKLNIKASPEYKAYIDLVVLLSIIQKVVVSPQKHKSVPYLCEIHENLFEYPAVLQILKDIINHPDFPKHLFVFMTSLTTLSQNVAFLENLHSQGFQIGIHVDKLPAPSLPSFLQVFYIDFPDLQSSLKGLAKRQFSHTIQTLTEQPYKVILGEVENEQVLQDILPAQFDFACGSALGKVQLWQDVLTKK